jgi:DNA-binding NtrC family response regulator
MPSPDKQILKDLMDGRFSFWDHIREYPFFAVNQKGQILESFSGQSFLHASLVAHIRRDGNIFKGFDFGKATDLKRLAPGRHLIYPRPGYFRLETADAFYTQLPMCYLSLSRIRQDLFAAALHLPKFLPIGHSRNSNPVIYLDARDRVVGFNHPFFDYFRTKFPNPNTLLGKPAHGLLAPTPGRVRQIFLKLKPKGREAVFMPFHDRQHSSQVEAYPASMLTVNPKGWHWNNLGETIAFLSWPLQLDMLRTECFIDLKLRLEKGSFPLVILGDRLNKKEDPDTFGYTLGVQPTPRRLSLKKFGYVMHQSSEVQAIMPGAYRIRVRMAAGGFQYKITGGACLTYVDPRPIEKEDFYISLGLRAGSHVKIDDIVIKTRQAANTIGPLYPLTRILTRHPQYATMDTFYNHFLSLAYPGTSGYVLKDVTKLKAELDRFRTLYGEEKKEGERLRLLLKGGTGQETVFLGESPAIKNILSQIDAVADSRATLLIEGDTGTGKEVFARFIHEQGHKANQPFVKVDCSTLSPTLIESELFGHERGAFTGADQARQGKLELAQNGTLFLDEVNNLPMDIQAKLLHFMQSQEFTRVGGTKSIALDLRIIIASNLRLEELVRLGNFRQDLYYRINILKIHLPPLCDRKEDIPVLSTHFIGQFSAQLQKPAPELSAGAYKKMYAHTWPGNIRELKNVLQRAVVFSEKKVIEAPDLDLPETSLVKKRGLEREAFINALEKAGGNIRQAARTLGVSRLTVYNYLKRCNVDLQAIRSKKEG